MSRKFKFINPEGIYFVSFATVNWVDVFLRPVYNDIIVQNLIYCKNNFGLKLYSWCIMPSRVHLVFRAIENNPSVLLGRFKEYTLKQLVKLLNRIFENPEEIGCCQCLRKLMQKAAMCNSVNFGSMIVIR
jgi:REP element-mobilizing transposase RayT